ncbi:hypothetical protein Pan216_21160 [Planctomycetes bacterium Pan216]|uniref:Uncharacterized protein n=1 Tax=Kolteria novifilia TaxID=2527975 RepID=A0A518B2U2_9BACT|nr:hypothetical protein Pan216_21160 [Planctomycetes bacterium Pan216]
MSEEEIIAAKQTVIDLLKESLEKADIGIKPIDTTLDETGLEIEVDTGDAHWGWWTIELTTEDVP